MFVKINRINQSNESKETIVDASRIVGIFENPTRRQSLYDEDGNEVETKTLEPTYNVEMGTFRFVVDAENKAVIEKALFSK